MTHVIKNKCKNDNLWTISCQGNSVRMSYESQLVFAEVLTGITS